MIEYLMIEYLHENIFQLVRTNLSNIVLLIIIFYYIAEQHSITIFYVATVPVNCVSLMQGDSAVIPSASQMMYYSVCLPDIHDIFAPKQQATGNSVSF